MRPQIFRHPHRVSYAECTVGNHVYHSRYLDILEAARGEFLRALDEPFLNLQHTGHLFPVVDCHLRYRHPARYDDLLTIEIWLTDLGRARLTFAYRILGPDGKLLLKATTEHACTSLADKPCRLPPTLSTKLLPFLDSPATAPQPAPQSGPA